MASPDISTTRKMNTAAHAEDTLPPIPSNAPSSNFNANVIERVIIHRINRTASIVFCDGRRPNLLVENLPPGPTIQHIITACTNSHDVDRRIIQNLRRGPNVEYSCPTPPQLWEMEQDQGRTSPLESQLAGRIHLKRAAIILSHLGPTVIPPEYASQDLWWDLERKYIREYPDRNRWKRTKTVTLPANREHPAPSRAHTMPSQLSTISAQSSFPNVGQESLHQIGSPTLSFPLEKRNETGEEFMQDRSQGRRQRRKSKKAYTGEKEVTADALQDQFQQAVKTNQAAIRKAKRRYPSDDIPAPKRFKYLQSRPAMEEVGQNVSTKHKTVEVGARAFGLDGVEGLGTCDGLVVDTFGGGTM